MRKNALVISFILLITTFSCFFPVKIAVALPPYTPTHPNPLNNSIDISIITDLSWDGGDPDPGDNVTYDVYFSENNPPSLRQKNITDLKYDPGTLNYSTTYHWMIVAWDINESSNSSPVWSFTTESENNPPYTPNSPTPSDNAHNISVNVNLSWVGGDPDSDSVTYDVYFGTSIPPSKVGVGNQSNTSYDPGLLEYTTVYNWKIVAWDAHGASADGPLWNFTTLSEPNQPPSTPATPFPDNNTNSISINVVLIWVGGDPDPGDSVTYDVYFGSSSPPPKVEEGNQSETSYDPGPLQYSTMYYWRIVAWDADNASSVGPLWNFRTRSETNSPPNIPSSPIPFNGSNGVAINTDIHWTGGDPDPYDTITYDVYIGTSNPPPKKVTNQTTTSYDPGTMNYSTTYYWRIVAWDDLHNSSPSPLFHFKTSAKTGGGSEEPPKPPQNIEPIADLSAKEPYQGSVDIPILFDGSNSHDPDGNITSWTWNFGDTTNANGVIKSHSFSQVGSYTITLTVTDNNGATDTDTTICLIRQSNRSPAKPTISGPTSGTKNTLYTYTAASTDPDSDPLQYTFQWAGSVSQSSGFLSSGMNYSVNHSWIAAGRYDLTVTVTDNMTNSSTKITIYIDAVQTRGAGYLLDNDGDGLYDAFYSEETPSDGAYPEKR